MTLFKTALMLGVCLSFSAVVHAQTHVHYKKMAYQKPGAAVVLASVPSYSLDAGETKTVTIELSAMQRSGTANVAIRLDPGLLLTSADESWVFDLSQTQQLALPIEVLAEKEGRYFIHLFTQIEDPNGQRYSRAQAVVVTVGDLGSSRQQKTDHSEYVVMHAQEAIFP